MLTHWSPDHPRAVVGRRVVRALLHMFGHNVHLPKHR